VSDAAAVHRKRTCRGQTNKWDANPRKSVISSQLDGATARFRKLFSNKTNGYCQNLDMLAAPIDLINWGLSNQDHPSF
jgi:hypothetical protein